MSAVVLKTLDAIERGDPLASAEPLPIVYDQLRVLAAKRISSEPRGQTLQATALVHEAYVCLVANQNVRWDSRAHLFAAAAEAIRRILIDRARAKKREKRGGNYKRFDLSAADLTIDAVPDEILDMDEALQKLAVEDPVKADLVKLRLIWGMTMRKAADFLGISTTTGDHYWAYARAFLVAEMRDKPDPIGLTQRI